MPDRSDPRRPSPAARPIVKDLIEVQGLSYADAIVAARNLAAPYIDAAETIEQWLEDSNARLRALEANDG